LQQGTADGFFAGFSMAPDARVIASEDEGDKRWPVERAFASCEPGKASEYIRGLDAIKPGTKVILICRVSEREQRRKRNLDDQERHLRRVMEGLSAIVVYCVKEVMSGWSPHWLARHADAAKRHEAVLVAESASRFVRSHGFHSENSPDAQSTTLDGESVGEWIHRIVSQPAARRVSELR